MEYCCAGRFLLLKQAVEENTHGDEAINVSLSAEKRLSCGFKSNDQLSEQLNGERQGE